MEKEFISSNDLGEDQLEEIFEEVENGSMIEVEGAFDDQCFVPVIRNQLDPSAAKIATKTRVERAKRVIELSRGREDETYRKF